MSEAFQWKDHTPPSLIEVVSHLRERWDDGGWKVSDVTRTLLFSALHPSVITDDLEQYRLAFGHLKRLADPQLVEVFNYLLRIGTEPALFHAYYSLRKSLLVREAEAIFLEFCSVGRAQAELLGEDFILWGRAHLNDLVEFERFRTPFWIKGVCDVRGYDLAADDEKKFQWNSWRAPMLVVMKPSRSLPYYAANAWDRADRDETADWLGDFLDEVKLAISSRLDQVTGALRLEIAKRAAPNAYVKPSSVEPPVTGPEEPVSFSPDLHSLRLFGEQIVLTTRQAKLISILYKAHESGHPHVSKARLLEAIEAETSDLRDFFRKTPLWKTVICSERRGTYRLNLQPVRLPERKAASRRPETGEIPT